MDIGIDYHKNQIFCASVFAIVLDSLCVSSQWIGSHPLPLYSVYSRLMVYLNIRMEESNIVDVRNVYM